MFQMYSVLSMYSMSFSRISEKVCMPTGSLFSGFFSISFLVLGGTGLLLQTYGKSRNITKDRRGISVGMPSVFDIRTAFRNCLNAVRTLFGQDMLTNPVWFPVPRHFTNSWYLFISAATQSLSVKSGPEGKP